MILLAPWMTEKTVAQAASGKYAFLVAPRSSKRAISDAVERQFGVSVTDVAVQNLSGKKMRLKGKKAPRRLVSRPDRRKATVTLKSGQTLDIYAGVEDAS